VAGVDGVVDAVERCVADGALVPGAALPTVRGLAEQLGVSASTVATAYKALGRRGTIVTDGRRGTRVAAVPALPIAAAVPVPAGVRDLRNGNPDPALLPDLTAVLHRLAPPPTSYGEGTVDLAELHALALDQFRADGVPAERVVVVSGALDGTERVLAAHLRPGDRVAVEDPGFPRVFDLVAAMGFVGVPVAVDDRGPEPAALARTLQAGARALIVTPRGQNPTGAAIDPARARELRIVLADHPHVLTVEDDHLGAIAGAALAPLATPSTHGPRRSGPRRSGPRRDGRGAPTAPRRWAVVRSVAKSLGPDLRLAVLTGDDTTLDRVEGRLRLGTGWVSHVLQAAVVDLWTNRAAIAAVARAERTYRRRREALVDALHGVGLDATGRSGLNVWVPVPQETATITGLLERGWAVAAGERFRCAAPPAIRITISQLTPAESRALASDLADVVRGHRRVATLA
jgi:DNA-binding transcriptional MocR family regulator